MTDLYLRMCRESPVQKDWKPKRGDFYIVLGGEGRLVKGGHKFLVTRERESKKFWRWLPRQEDWQKIAEDDPTTDKKTGCGMPRPHELAKWIEDNFGDIENYSNILHHKGWEAYWCLFVHKEVYKLVWDWDENRWVKE